MAGEGTQTKFKSRLNYVKISDFDKRCAGLKQKENKKTKLANNCAENVVLHLPILSFSLETHSSCSEKSALPSTKTDHERTKDFKLILMTKS